jgi:hypothetical protein
MVELAVQEGGGGNSEDGWRGKQGMWEEVQTREGVGRQ